MAGDADQGKPEEPGGGGLPEALQAAVERTFSAVADQRGRALSLRPASREELKRLESRLADLETAVKRLEERLSAPESKDQVEG